jgi:hypothetical protein
VSNENKVCKDGLFFLDVGAGNLPDKDGIITVLVSYDNKEQIKNLKELALGLLAWIERNEQEEREDTEVVPWEEARERLMKLD